MIQYVLLQTKIDIDRGESNSQYAMKILAYYNYIRALENKGYDIIDIKLEGNELSVAEAGTSSVNQN